MRYRLVPLLAALVLLVACGGDDKPRGNTLNDDEDVPTTTDDSDAGDPEATPAAVAKVVLQIDTQLRRAFEDARDCIYGDGAECEGLASDAYLRLGRQARGGADLLPQLRDPESPYYYGQMSSDLAGLLTRTTDELNEVATANEQAVAECLPTRADGCGERNQRLSEVVIALLGTMQDWRKLA